MTRSLRPRARAGTQPICVQRPRDPAVVDLGFTCFRLIQSSEGPVLLELCQSSARMFVFVARREC